MANPRFPDGWNWDENVCARTYAHWIGGVDSEAAQVLERARRVLYTRRVVRSPHA